MQLLSSKMFETMDLFTLWKKSKNEQKENNEQYCNDANTDISICIRQSDHIVKACPCDVLLNSSNGDVVFMYNERLTYCYGSM